MKCFFLAGLLNTVLATIENCLQLPDESLIFCRGEALSSPFFIFNYLKKAIIETRPANLKMHIKPLDNLYDAIFADKIGVMKIGLRFSSSLKQPGYIIMKYRFKDELNEFEDRVCKKYYHHYRSNLYRPTVATGEFITAKWTCLLVCVDLKCAGRTFFLCHIFKPERTLSNFHKAF